MDQLNTKFSVRKPTKSDDEDSFPPPPPVGTPPEFTSIDGRRYSNKGNASYILPNDNTESTRLNSQHYQWRYLFQGSFNSPMTEELKKGIKVLDVGCGTGVWCVEMATEFQESSFIGTDITEVFAATPLVPSNCSFIQADTQKGLPFEENTFDFVFMRAQTLCYPEKIWPDVIKELARVAKVNGMVEIFDTTVTVRDGGPSFTTLINEWLATALRMRDIDTTVIARLEPMFVSAGIGPVTHLSAQWPLGWDPTNTQYTKMSKENVLSLLQGIKPQILAALGIADKEYTKHFDNVELEFGEYKPHFDLEFYYGRKNGASKSS